MKMKTVASSRHSRRLGAVVGCAFAAQTNADHAHQISASASIERPKPDQVKSRESSEVTCVTANTNTRSHNSSSGLVRRSSSTPS